MTIATLVLALVALVCAVRALNIALHAQALPLDGVQIVGSVVTTQGLRRALADRAGVDNVTVFYPGAYADLRSRHWDVVVVEGWFPSLPEFLALARSANPAAALVFYCLDPAYPALDTMLRLDVDGVMTNSRRLHRHIFPAHGIPSALHALAADTEVMTPVWHDDPVFPALYVGAAGVMLQAKPALHAMLSAAKPFGLTIYGNGWQHIEDLRDVWAGVLPQSRLSWAYAHARVVLAATVAAQEDYGMINNRIYEALACGAIVVTAQSPTLQDVFGDEVLVYYNASWPVAAALQLVLVTWTDAERARRRRRGRAAVERLHSWRHRVVDMENFWQRLVSEKRWTHLPQRATDRRAPRALVVVADGLRNHIDYISVLRPHVLSHLTQIMATTFLSETEFFAAWQTDEAAFLSEFSVVLLVCAAFDALDRATLSWPFPLFVRDQVQRRGVYFLGWDHAGWTQCLAHFGRARCQDAERHDAVFVRCAPDADRIEAAMNASFPTPRVQHVFGVDVMMPVTEKQRVYLLVVCFLDAAALCTATARSAAGLAARAIPVYAEHATLSRTLLILVGGEDIGSWQRVEEALNVSILPSVRDDGSRLQDVYLVADGVPRVDVFALFADAGAVVFLNALVTQTTGDDVLSFLVTAAVTNASVYLLHRHEPWLQLAASWDIGQWDQRHLEVVRRQAFDRLLGFPPAQAQVELQSVELPWDAATASWSAADRHPTDALARPLQESLLLLRQLCQPFAIMRIHRSPGFRVGFEGQLCLRSRPGRSVDVLCLMRDASLLLVLLNHTSTCARAEPQAVALDMWLRGNVFGDAVRQWTVPVSLQRPMSCAATTTLPHLPFPSDVFVYNYHMH